jgi:hypothetical protein
MQSKIISTRNFTDQHIAHTSGPAGNRKFDTICHAHESFCPSASYLNPDYNAHTQMNKRPDKQILGIVCLTTG